MQALQRFRLIFKSVKKHFLWVEQQTGVSGAQLWALAAVVKNPGLKVAELVSAQVIHQSTASNLVDKMVKQTYIRRVPPHLKLWMAPSSEPSSALNAAIEAVCKRRDTVRRGAQMPHTLRRIPCISLSWPRC